MTAPPGSRAGDTRGQLGLRLCRKCRQSTRGGEAVPHLSPVLAAGAREQWDPQGPSKGSGLGGQQGWSKEAVGAGRVPHILPWGLLSAQGWGPAQLRHPRQGGWESFGVRWDGTWR